MIGIALLILTFAVGSWLLIRWARKKDAEARRIAAAKTAAEVKVETARVMAEEKARSDESAWEEFKKNHPGSSPP